MFKRIVLTVLASAGFIAPAVVSVAPAAADQTVSIPSFNCSTTAYTPKYNYPQAGFMDAPAGMSCGGSDYNRQKRIRVQMMDLVSGGWQVVADTGFTAWYTVNPLTAGEAIYPCVHGRWYATRDYADVSNGSWYTEGSANTFSSGTQCP